jgi:hypothetical protein
VSHELLDGLGVDPASIRREAKVWRETMLGLADIAAEVAEAEETSAIPVPEKVLNAMRRCQAGIIARDGRRGPEGRRPKFRASGAGVQRIERGNRSTSPRRAAVTG